MPGGNIYINDAARRSDERTHERILWAFGSTHRERRPLYCAVLASIAAQTNGSYDHDGSAIDYIVRLFLRLDSPPQDCGKQIRAAFPQTEAVERHLAESNGICLTDLRQCRSASIPRRRRP